MDHDMQKYLRVLNESSTIEPTDDTLLLREAIEGMELVEDNSLSRSDVAKLLTINDDDVDLMFDILGKNMNAKRTLSELDSELVMNGIETVSPENSDEVFHYLRNGDLYKSTIIYYDKKYYIGSIGSLMESNFDLTRIQRIK